VCGIIGYLGPGNAVPILLDGLKRLEYRGYDSAGVAVLREGKILVRRVKGKIRDLDESSGVSLEEAAGWGIRAGPPTAAEGETHPHRDCSGTVGRPQRIIEITSRSRKSSSARVTSSARRRIPRSSPTSLRSIFRALDSCDGGHSQARGAYAVAAMSTHDPDKIVAAKTGPPAVVGLGDNEYLISSDINPILGHTSRVVFLGDNEIAVLERQGVRFLDFQGNSLNKTVDHLSWNPLMIEKKGFKHFMLKEIFEQPQVVRDTLAGRISQGSGCVYLDESLTLRWRRRSTV
jgi:glucosamine--fructose-6-phosphate aminotransferase (isomerizing)